MPAKYRTKQYSEDSYYHIYNRGVEKRLIFLAEQDYAVFLSYLKEYLLPKDEVGLSKKLSDPNTSYKDKGKILKILRLNNFANEITLVAYCLMPNHFHLLVKQKGALSIDKFMQSLATRYTMYFNRKYKRVGFLCQDVYKAVLIESDEQLLYLSSYIHRNPLKNVLKSQFTQNDVIRAYFSQPSSYPEFLGQRYSAWVHPEEILAHFSRTNPKLSYQAFMQQTDELSIIEPIQSLALDII